MNRREFIASCIAASVCPDMSQMLADSPLRVIGVDIGRGESSSRKLCAVGMLIADDMYYIGTADSSHPTA